MNKFELVIPWWLENREDKNHSQPTKERHWRVQAGVGGQVTGNLAAQGPDGVHLFCFTRKAAGQRTQTSTKT